MGLILEQLHPDLKQLSVTIVGSGLSLFPVVESLAKLGRSGAPGLEELSLDLELATQHLSVVASALARCHHLKVLRLPRVTSGAPGFKQLQMLLRDGQLLELEVK